MQMLINEEVRNDEAVLSVLSWELTAASGKNPRQVRRVKRRFRGNCTPREQLHFCSPLRSYDEMFAVAWFSDVRQSVIAEGTWRIEG